MGLRSLVLLRHGEYRLDDGPDPGLTLLGQRQARFCEVLLRRERFDRVYTSPLVRARETCAEVVGPWRVKPTVSTILAEGVPTKVASLGVSAREAAVDRARFERVFSTFFAPVKSETSELIVCHGNLIRYLVARSLGVPARTWTKLVSNHCGITRIFVRESRLRVVSYNETGHLPPDAIT